MIGVSFLLVVWLVDVARDARAAVSSGVGCLRSIEEDMTNE